MEKKIALNTFIFFTVMLVTYFSTAMTDTCHAQDDSPVALETITVTANKQEEDIQKVPISITGFDSHILEDKNISSLAELADFVPNLGIICEGFSSMHTPVMRGIYNEMGTSSVSTPIMVDRIPILSFSGYEDTLQNIDRVEVLRGPQGTLYGKNALAGGTLNFSKDFLDQIMAKIYKALSPDGIFISIHDVLTPDGTGPAVSVRRFLPMALAGQDFYLEAGSIANAMARAGMQAAESRSIETPMGPLQLDIGRASKK